MSRPKSRPTIEPKSGYLPLRMISLQDLKSRQLEVSEMSFHLASAEGVVRSDGPSCRQVQSIYSASEVSLLICIRSAWSAPTTQRNWPVSSMADAMMAPATSSAVASATGNSELKTAIRWFT
jgi:hypothetical protein